MNDDCHCPIARHVCEPDWPEPDWRSDREEAVLDATVRWAYPDHWKDSPL